ncbi:phage integrase N-terminal SAM-like domain-containing protein [Xanthomonas perforans]|uniref:Phage integrase N-terminal SAM-like domain-containing protein n=1 Tax=Xanthomonas euvesicatoria TaxID=456327 RepID=A0AAX4FEL6_XANEU|nr:MULTISPECIES: phage integrase N-terminal SAM-like domain-containing protein [Xanthomonas]PWH22042.1 recombinase [Xanthomonas perforans]WOP46549.1 phage integrase N-terminal SAM-like domain-containing protein [Xanthomonas euvesicatoria]WOP53993.1 phage integrase N-terminal SAM-like domain-containing protein [Xanthomonas euvesicatoria]WOP55080.1 phage integrase N-terminal SAM-like domain-containing protein [Xanthomonas euvesicatoria]
MKYATKNNGVTARPPTQLLGQVRNRLRAGQRRAGLSEPVLFVQMGQARVEAFLTRLATDAQVSAARRTRRLAVLLFFYREVLRIDRHDVPDEIPSCHNLG